MVRPRKTVPAYRLHLRHFCGKASVGYETIYFPGRYNSPESPAAYRDWFTIAGPITKQARPHATGI
jgi:hypothetical protein